MLRPHLEILRSPRNTVVTPRNAEVTSRNFEVTPRNVEVTPKNDVSKNLPSTAKIKFHEHKTTSNQST
jgi:hypothetical protein